MLMMSVTRAEYGSVELFHVTPSGLEKYTGLPSGLPGGPPVQIICNPTIAYKCDHTYLPGRDPLPQRVFMSYVEDETVPPFE